MVTYVCLTVNLVQQFKHCVRVERMSYFHLKRGSIRDGYEHCTPQSIRMTLFVSYIGGTAVLCVLLYPDL